jgi:hypothetical protein
LLHVTALLGLGLLLAMRQWAAPAGLVDYSVFYLGGKVAWQGNWDDLYPVPTPGADAHPGLPLGSEMKPGYQALADANGIHDPYRFVYPPPSAILLAPFGALGVESSLAAWRFVLILSCWLAGLMASELYTRLTGRRDVLGAAIVFLVTWSPLSWATVRSTNSSALVGAMIGLMVYGLVARRPWMTALGFYAGAVVKFATLPLLALPVFLGKFRAAAACVAAAVVLTAAAVAVTGIGPWREYVQLFPTLGLPVKYPVNISLLSFINQAVPGPAQPAALFARNAALLGTLVVLLVGLARHWRTADARPVLAAASALLGWFLIFAPTTENHYFVYLFPLWGYYAAECRSGWLGRLAALAVIGGTVVPLGGSSRPLPVWLQCHQLWAAVVALAFGALRLYQYSPSRRLARCQGFPPLPQHSTDEQHALPTAN